MSRKKPDGAGVFRDDNWTPKERETIAHGRWPAHLLLSHTEDCQPGTCAPCCPVRELDEQSSGASRYFTQFFYCPKASRAERNLGCETLPARRVAHMGHDNNELDERTQSFRLRSDLTPEQRAYVEQELAKIGGAF